MPSEPQVPWQFHGQPEEYIYAVRLYLTELVKRLLAEVNPDTGRTTLHVVMEDLETFGLVPPKEQRGTPRVLRACAGRRTVAAEPEGAV